ncbi:MAG: methyltransferase domain-containing protein [Candidatus Eremiobacteraeota bacterium]|nr:methyltransferase domain-containing protein [Candidatus Eremiobacteraeota bacterium]MBV8280863.1 methyltransferase domain-containing protein [Candidatus Eremiobacteraeota bacterium]
MRSTVRDCPVCGAAAAPVLHERDAVPVHQNLLFDTAEAARAVARGRIELAACMACGFVFNAAFDERLLSYGARYENAQDCSPAFAAYVADLVARIVDAGARGAQIVELGCGKGTFLRRLVEDVSLGNSGLGIDPAYVGPETDLDGRIRFRRTFFESADAADTVDVVVCRHVIEHVASPVAMLEGVRDLVSASPHARVYFETPCVDWVLGNRVIWDIFYEHCSYFNPRSLRYAFERCGFAVGGVRHVFGGQYLWLEASPAPPGGRGAAPSGGESTAALAREFAAAFESLAGQWGASLGDAAAHGKTAVWGAGAKGVTFANLLDPQGTSIDCVIDINPRKQGRYLPGTGHPIVSYREAAHRGVRTAFLMNPNYAAENRALLEQAGLNMELR